MSPFTTSRAQDHFSSEAGYRRNNRVTANTIGNYLSATDTSNRDSIVSVEHRNGCRN
jgi:hypothetical protein